MKPHQFLNLKDSEQTFENLMIVMEHSDLAELSEIRSQYENIWVNFKSAFKSLYSNERFKDYLSCFSGNKNTLIDNVMYMQKK